MPRTATTRDALIRLETTVAMFMAAQEKRDAEFAREQEKRHAEADRSREEIHKKLNNMEIAQAGMIRQSAALEDTVGKLSDQIEVIDAGARKIPQLVQDMAEVKPKVERLDGLRQQHKGTHKGLAWAFEALRFLAAMAAGFGAGHWMSGPSPR